MNTKQQFIHNRLLDDKPKRPNVFTLHYAPDGDCEDIDCWHVVRSTWCDGTAGRYLAWYSIGTFDTYTMARIFLRAVRQRNKGKKWDRQYRRLYPNDCVVHTNNPALLSGGIDLRSHEGVKP